MKTSTAFLSLMASTASALSTFSPGSGISYAIAIPKDTAQSGSGDFYFQMVGPTTYQWIAMGIGEEMAGSSIFVMYANGAGNVTVSPRLGQGNFEPQPNPQATLQLLEGSGIKDGMMTANVKCIDCSKWPGGSIDYTSNSQSFINAHRTGAALDTTSASTELIQHQNNGEPFTFDLTQAAMGNATANPFVAAAPTLPAGNSGSSPDADADDDDEGNNMILMAHGIIMGLTVVILIPLGALMMRLAPVPWWVHGGLQTSFLLLLTAGWALGYVNAGQQGIRFTGPGYTHTVFGTVIFALFWIQPFLGYAHHLIYKKRQARHPVSHAHIWWGRIVMILAIINGGLGLQLADNTTGGEIAYGVLAGIVGLVYIIGAVFGETRRGRKTPASVQEKALSITETERS